MALLDMSDAILEPLFQTLYSVIRQQEVVDSYGVASMVSTEIGPLSGVVFDAGGSTLDRQPGFAITPKVIGVCGTFFLYAESAAAGTTHQPDIVVWNGNNYIVKTLNDWSNYGPGFTYATCMLTDNIATPTGTVH